jgi:uncharacterized protein YdeI (YjbR/CyaY-like superfamily)
MKTLVVRSLEQWRRWLSQHHDAVSEIWLVLYKRQARVESLRYPDARDEALCFGWVDSLVKRLDDHRYALKFTPRRPDSRWSAVNRKRYAELEATGRLKRPGIERAPTDRGYGPRPKRLELPVRLPVYIQAALKRDPPARRHFQAIAPEERRRFYAWIESAKREETKLRRLDEALRLLAKGQVLGLK